MTTVAVRSVTARLDADVAAYIAKMKAAGAATDAAFGRSRAGVVRTDQSLRELTTTAQKTGPAIRGIGQEMGAFDSSLKRTDRSINQLTGRLKLVGQLTATLGPGLVPIGAIGIPAIAGLTTGFAAAAGAGASLIAATQGVGDAVKALEAARLDPTTANLQAARSALAQLGPDAAAFAVTWQTKAIPAFREIRDMSAAGWLPGLDQAVDELDVVGPKIGSIFEAIGRAGGEAAAAGADSLGGDRWDQVFAFAERELPMALTSLSQIVGDVTHGIAGMWMALDPGSDQFLGWLRRVADGFDTWANSAEGAKSINELLDYASEHGPQVAELFTSVATALAHIVEAAAPLGGPVLSSLTAVAKLLGAVADSNLGTPILAGVAALSAYNRVLSITSRLSKSSALGGSMGSAGPFALLNAEARKSIPTLQQFGTVAYRAGQSSKLASKETLAARTAVRGFAGNLSRAAGPIAGIAAATGALGESANTSTVTFGLMGAALGPVGAAVGVLAGSFVDAQAESKALTESTRELNRVMESGSVGQMSQSLASNRAALAASRKDLTDVTGAADLLSDTWRGWDERIFGADQGPAKAISQAADQYRDTISALGDINAQLGGDSLGVVFGGELSTAQATKFQAVVTAIQPALDRLGISLKDLDKGDNIARVANEVEYLESSKGRIDAVGSAFTGLNNRLLTTATSASQLSSALSALIDPNINAERATIAWREALRGLSDELARTKTLAGNSAAADKNKTAILDRVDALKQMLSAEAEAGAGPAKLARTLDNQTRSLIQTGVAAGLTRVQLENYLKKVGLTPALVKTTFEAAGVSQAEQKARGLRGTYDRMPKGLKTEIASSGIPRTIAQVNALVERYQLTEKQRTALLTIRDLASRDLAGVQKALGILDRTKTSAKITAETQAATNAMNAIRAQLRAIDGDTATTYVRTVRTTTGPGRSTLGGPTLATGGHVTGPGGPRDDVIPALLSNGEYVVKAAAVDRYGVAMMHQINSLAYAEGGMVRRRFADGGDPGKRKWTIPGYIDSEPLREAMRGAKSLSEGLKRAQKALEQETTARDNLKSRLNDVKAGVSDGLRSDLFETSGDVWSPGATANPTAVANADTAEALEFGRLVKLLKGRGLDGPTFVEAVKDGSIEKLRVLAAMPVSALKGYESAYERRERVLASVSKQTGNTAYGPQLTSMEKELREMKQEVKRLHHSTKREHDKDRQNRTENRKESDEQNRRVRAMAVRRIQH